MNEADDRLENSQRANRHVDDVSILLSNKQQRMRADAKINIQIQGTARGSVVYDHNTRWLSWRDVIRVVSCLLHALPSRLLPPKPNGAFARTLLTRTVSCCVLHVWNRNSERCQDLILKTLSEFKWENHCGFLTTSRSHDDDKTPGSHCAQLGSSSAHNPT